MRRKTEMWTKTRAFIAALIILGAELFSGCGNPSGGKPPSTDAALGSLHIEGGELISPFDPDTTDYTVVVENSTANLVINATPRSPDASVSGAGELGTLEEGETLRELAVTAQDGVTQKTYSLVILRLDPLGFGPAAGPPLLIPGPGEGQLAVQWDAVYGAEAWELLYNTDDDINGVQTIDLEAGILNYTIEEIIGGMDYYVWVRAKKGERFKELPPANTSIPAVFTSFETLGVFLGSAPQNSAAVPYFVTMSGLTTADLNKVINGVDVSMGALFSALQGKYVTVDLSALTGPTIPSVSVQASMDRKMLTGLILPGTLEDLGADVFQGCSNLAAVEFGEHLVSIGERAFQHSGLKALELPDSLQTIGGRAFEGTALETLELSPGLTVIGDSAFSCPGLTRVDFREGPGAAGLSIGAAFAGCRALTTARLPDNLDSLGGSFGNCPALELLSIPATTNSVSDSVASQSGKLRFEVRGLGKFGTALEGRVLTQVEGTIWIVAPGLGGGDIEVPEGVIEIVERFFYGNTELVGITLPSTLATINERMFQGCSALERATMIGGSITRIGDYAFFNCSALASIELPESLLYIGASAFRNCGSLRSITIPSKVKEYGEDAQGTPFANCSSLEYADIRTPHLTPFMFIGCQELKEISLAPETTEIPSRAFEGCVKLAKINPGGGRDINLPSGLETIRSNAFRYCPLGGELEIPPGVTAIETVRSGTNEYMSAFQDNPGITGLILPRSLDGDLIAVFTGCSNIESFGLNGTGEVLKVSPEGKLLVKGDTVYMTAKTLGDITIPAGVQNYRKIAGNLSLTGLVFEEDPERTSIPESAFSGCANLVWVTLSGDIQAINNYAFNGCGALEELVITNTSSTELTYPASGYVFRNCRKLASIKVPQALVETYKADSRWQVKPSGVYGAPYLTDMITGY
jgi:hypothetical protein